MNLWLYIVTIVDLHFFIIRNIILASNSILCQLDIYKFSVFLKDCWLTLTHSISRPQCTKMSVFHYLLNNHFNNDVLNNTVGNNNNNGF